MEMILFLLSVVGMMGFCLKVVVFLVVFIFVLNM